MTTACDSCNHNKESPVKHHITNDEILNWLQYLQNHKKTLKEAIQYIKDQNVCIHGYKWDERINLGRDKGKYEYKIKECEKEGHEHTCIDTKRIDYFHSWIIFKCFYCGDRYKIFNCEEWEGMERAEEVKKHED
jgi:hypothetical protein